MSASKKAITQSEFFPGVAPKQIYDAMLDGAQHTEMTGGSATAEPRVGAEFTAWDGYIFGTNLELEDGKRILQTWETSEWPEDAPPSHLEWLFTAKDGGTQVTMNHTDVPASQVESYRQGWTDYYWTPMKAYFAR